MVATRALIVMSGSRQRFHRDRGATWGMIGELLGRVKGAGRLQVSCDRTAFRGCAGRVVRHHAAGFPVAGEHHVGGRRAPARQLRRQPDAPRMRGDPALYASSPRRRRETQPDHLRRQRHHAVARLRARGSPQRAEGARHAALHEPHVVHIALGVGLAPAHGDEHTVAVGRIDDVGPDAADNARPVQLTSSWVRLFFVEEFLPYSWAFLPADASLQCSFRGDSNQASAYPRLSGGQPSLETVPNTVGLSPSGALPSGHSRGVLVRCRGKGGRPAMAVTTGFQGRTFDVPRTGVPCIDLPSRAPCAAADAVFADAKAFLSSSEARQMSESELERELHRRRQDLVRKLLQGHRDQRSPKEAAGPAEDTSGVECSEPREHESHAETTSGTMQVVGLGCARRGHDGLHRLDAALNLLPERYLVEMRRRVTIATASRAPPRTPWKPQWYSTSSTWQRRRGVRCSSSARRRACRHLVRDPMGVDRRTVTFGCSCGGSQPPQAAGALMRTETSHEAREDQRKSPIGR